jgi:exodeoxyribonuclease VII small subunit
MTQEQQPAPTYTAAAKELDAILDEIERGSVDIDTLSLKVERAAWLIAHCKEQLARTALRVTTVLEQLEEQSSVDRAGEA